MSLTHITALYNYHYFLLLLSNSLLSSLYLMDNSSQGFNILYSPSLSEMVKIFSQRIPDAQKLVSLPPDAKELKIAKTGYFYSLEEIYIWTGFVKITLLAISFLN